MPVKLGSDSKGCYASWGERGHRYYYECGNENDRNDAKQKAYKQGVAIGEYEIYKVSYDYDMTLTNKIIQERVKRDLRNGKDVYVISARGNKDNMLKLTNLLGIKQQNVYATGSNRLKIMKINELGMKQHIDNNASVIKVLGRVGKNVSDILKSGFKQYKESVDSTNADIIKWDSVTKDLTIKFQDGSIYTYSKVPEGVYNKIIDGMAGTRTSGEHGPIGKYPSVGAAIHVYLIEGGFEYRKGGTI